MKTFFAALVGTLFLATAAVAAPPAVRQARQSARIQDGVQDGSLTRGETNRIVAQQGRIQKVKAHAKSDGVVTHQERRRLEQLQDMASKQIYRAKHNAR